MTRRMLMAIVAALGGLAAATDAVAAPLVIAHRGASSSAPENTLEAFAMAWEQEADGIEADFHLSKDGAVVCLHDDNTKRTAPGSALRVVQSTLPQLRALDVGKWKGDKFAGARIPTLAEVAAAIPEGKMFFVELKTGPEIVAPAAQILRASKLKPEQIVVISFHEATVAAAKKALPEATVLWLTELERKGAAGSKTPDEVVAVMRRANADGLGLNCKHPPLTREFREALARQGVRRLATWTVDDPQGGRYFRDLKVDFLITNKPGEMRGWLKDK